MEKIKFLIDSGSDISKEDAQRYDVEVIPLSRIVKGEPLVDYYDFDIAQWSEYLRNCDEIPTTSQPSPDRFLEAFEKFSGEYEHILCITMSVYGSGTYNSAMIAKGMFEERHPDHPCHIFVVDSWSCSLNEVIELKAAHQMMQDGKSITEILNELDMLRRKVCTYYLVDNIEFLIKGGRVSTLKGAIASKLKLKPIVNIKNGQGSNMANALGYQNGISKLASFFLEDCDETGEAYISHANCPQKAMDLVEKIRQTYPEIRYHIYPMLGTMATQSGPDSIGLFYVRTK